MAMSVTRRCDWSDRENTYLLLARVALGLLIDTYKVPSRQYLTVRDALHETIEVMCLVKAGGLVDRRS